MQLKRFTLGYAGGCLLVLSSASYAADTPSDMTASPPPEATAAPADATAAPPADAMGTPSTDASTPPPQVAVETPADVRAASAEQRASLPQGPWIVKG